MNYKYIFFLLFFSLSVSAQERSIYGKIINQKTKEPLESVNVTNKRNKQIGVSNANGDFYLRALPSDSILITSIGYKRVGIKWDGISKEPIIELSQDAILLSEVVIKQQRQQLLTKQIDEFLANPRNRESMLAETKSNILNTNMSSPGAGIGISIDALYDLYSKEGKLKRKVAELEYQDKIKYYSELRLNKQFVQHTTKLPDEDIEEFIKYCRLDPEFILRATDYELAFEVLKYRKRFVNNRIFRRSD